jgi:hypothetical protein
MPTMSRTLFAVLLSELNTLRLICKRKACSGVLEMSIEQFGVRPDFTCPACGGRIGPETSDPHKRFNNNFAKAIEAIRSHHEQFDVEFIIPNSEAD